jgi:hypothetical protein
MTVVEQHLQKFYWHENTRSSVVAPAREPRKLVLDTSFFRQSDATKTWPRLHGIWKDPEFSLYIKYIANWISSHPRAATIAQPPDYLIDYETLLRAVRVHIQLPLLILPCHRFAHQLLSEPVHQRLNAQ